ncbi:50S ribosomal protein L25/general stress protein Ctc [Basilea psittacipulmonis]|uniref:Large ribosomal subunit protein bL25 n=1 Tax=Basilea psittacipulmonis DSM 24701 TaxID=1072685 RepID=A0A077DCY7_9BURK|nr:50S ribosomal protein L25/general stress protein Ctc [Basilea psittacipulmonis]AIL32474.1 50S ribosomal protein L25 [Basilea psittacipulmonis DSM 24701]
MKFNAVTRGVQGSSASRRLRRAGRLPGIVYGGGEPAVSIDLDHNEIYYALQKEAFHSSILELSIDGKVEQVLLRASQWHPYKPQVLHIDFQRVKAGEMLTTSVPLHFLNAEISPAVKEQGAQINTVMNEVEISCLPRHLPSHIDVDLSKMNDGDVLTVANLIAPEGVQFTHVADESAVVAVASVIQEAASQEDAEATQEETTAEA